jgi:hypothetical protein
MEARTTELIRECDKLMSQASHLYVDVGAMGGSVAVALMFPMSLNDMQVELLVLSVTTCARMLHDADKLAQEFFTKSMELGLLKGVQEALMATQLVMSDDSHGGKKQTTH